MVQVAGSGSDVRLDPDLLDHLGASQDPTDILDCWTATTEDYLPLLLIELSGGLVVARADDPSGASAFGLRWADLTSVTQDERAWMLLLTPLSAPPVRLLFASLGELRLVAARIASRCAEGSAPIAQATAGPGTWISPAGTVSRSQGMDGAPSPSLRSAPVRVRSAGHGSARAGHGPRSLARIERRLATVESLLADLTVAAPPPAERTRR